VKLIDTHCHLAHGRVRPGLQAVLEQARAAGLEAIICAASDLRESRAAADLADSYPDIYCMAGVHPHDAKDLPGDYLRQIELVAGHAKNVAIGEIGLDYHYNFSPPADQRRVFAEQLSLAAKLGKKVVIHTREAFDDTMAILAESPVDGCNVIFHSFNEGPERLGSVMDRGAAVSFSGIVTFTKAEQTRESARAAARDRVLIETDAPFLSPEPVRKMRTNVPANVVHIAALLADLYGMGTEQLAEITTANARRLFGLA